MGNTKLKEPFSTLILSPFFCICRKVWKSKKGGRRGSKWWREVKSSGGRDRWDRGLLHRYSESVSGTSEVEDICFVLKSALGPWHDETQPGVPQHSKILPLVSPPPPLLANQEVGEPEEKLNQPCYLSSSSPPYFGRSLLPLCCIHFKWELSSERLYVIGHTMMHIFCNFCFFLMCFFIFYFFYYTLDTVELSR